MSRIVLRLAIFATVIGIGVSNPNSLRAHPHAWIDLWVEVVFNESGAATGLRQTWLFDDFFSAYATEGMDEDGDGQPDKEPLAQLVRENIESLAEYQYFTKAWIGGNTIKLNEVTEMSAEVRENRLAMIYYVPFVKPVRTDIGPLVYSVYDPTYYIEILHAEAEDAIQLASSTAGCSYHLLPPDPKEEEVALAASLAPSESAGDGLGQYFAERVTISCTSHG